MLHHSACVFGVFPAEASAGRQPSGEREAFDARSILKVRFSWFSVTSRVSLAAFLLLSYATQVILIYAVIINLHASFTYTEHSLGVILSRMLK